jgi:membrane fusion protein (multidrug efflux system)
MENESVKKKSPVRFIVLGVVLLGALFYGWRWYDHGQHYESTDNAQIETHTSPVLARVAGYLQKVNITDFTEVKMGDTLAVIDDMEARIAVQQAQADFRQAQADYEQAKADLATTQADLRNARVGRDNADLNVDAVSANTGVIAVRRDKAFADYQRDQRLALEKAITTKQLDDSKARYEELVKSYEAAISQQNFSKGGVNSSDVQIQKVQAQLLRNAALLQRAEATIAVRKAQLDQAQLRLGYTRIPAPISGRIGKKNMEPGQYVQPGQTLCTIVNDDSYWIVANFKETQIGRMSEGQSVEIHLDAYPGKPITGKIASLSEATGAKFALLPPDNASGNFVKVTQRVPVKIALDNVADLRGILRAGLSAVVEVKVQ